MKSRCNIKSVFAEAIHKFYMRELAAERHMRLRLGTNQRDAEAEECDVRCVLPLAPSL